MKPKAYFGIIAFFVGALPAQTRRTSEPHSSAPAQHFVCNIGFTQKECDQEMAVLRKALAKYRGSELGEWTWVLVRSEDWKLILVVRRLDPGIPAFTALAARMTFFEEALLAGATGRLSELMAVWHMGRESLLDSAIRHELGHPLCNDTNEAKADRAARSLEQKKPISCQGEIDASQMRFALPEIVFARVADPSPAIRVRVDNYAQASAAILARAEREAGRILGEAGLRTVWLDCPVRQLTDVPQDPCQEPLEATDIVLRVLSEPTQNRLQSTVFGFAVAPVLASVYYEYASRRAKSGAAEFEVPFILGCVIAHEVGHLLLGSNSHSGSGVMQPQLGRKQIQQAMMGTLHFTPEQAKLIQAEAQLRMRLQTASLKERPMGAVDHQVGLKVASAE